MKKFSLLIVAAVLLITCVLGFAACDKDEKKIADNTEHFTDITKTLTLSKEYKGKTLSVDGIGEANLLGSDEKTTDGDTTTFGLKNGGSEAVRYQAVDTPESTGGVERWGVAASKFTNERLHEATEIVLEGTLVNGKLDRDTVGQRALCYVWYKTADHDFWCLNLELMENGFSAKPAPVDSPYYSYFEKAQAFAKGIKLRVFSSLPDPLFDMDPIDIKLKDLNEHPNNYKEYSKVVLDAFILEAKITSTYTFTIAQYDEETGKIYSLPLYAGHSDDSAAGLNVGDLYHIEGTLQIRDGNWQISGVQLDEWKKNKEGYTWTKQNAYYKTFDSSSKMYTGKLTANACTDLTVTKVGEVAEGKLTFKGTAKTYYDEEVSCTFSVTVPTGYNKEIAVGKTLVINGAFQFTEKSNQYTILTYSDITIK